MINLKTSDRVFMTGKTGSGKTYLARNLTASLPRLVVLDGKGTLSRENGWNLDPWDKSTVKQLRTGAASRLRVLAPIRLADAAAFWDEVLYTCYQSQNLVIYIDELYSICPPSKAPSPMIFSIYTRGRELGIGTWAATQRPVWVPLVGMSEAEHFFVFRLQLPDDRKRITEVLGSAEVATPINDPYGFYYMRPEDDTPTYFRQYQNGGVKTELINPEPNKKKSSGILQSFLYGG